MDFKQIQELIKMINKSNIGELTVEQKDFRITIKQKEEPAQIFSAPMQQAPVQMSATQSATGQSQQVPAAEKSKPVAETPAGNTITIKSPMIGTFYRRSSP